MFLKNPSNSANQPGRLRAPAWPELAVALISGAIFVWAHLQALTNPWIINDDVRQQIYWMQQWQDPALFQGDFLTGYARHYVTWGVKGLYWLASWWVPPLWFAKLLPGLLFIGLAVALFQIGSGLADRRLGWMMAAGVWLIPFFLDNLAGGLARAFAAPLLALIWLGWQRRRPGVMAAALLLQALFIPYSFLVAALAVLLAWALARLGKGTPPPFPARGAHFVLLGLGAVLVVAMQAQFSSAGYGPLVSAQEMVNHPEFYAHGRYQFLPEASLLWELITPVGWIIPLQEWGPVGGAIIGAGLLALMVVAARRLDWASWRARLQPLGYLLAASLCLYFVARLFLLKLFVPDRYLMYTLNLAYCLWLAVGLHAALRADRWPRHLAILALGVAVTLGAGRLTGVGLKDYSAYQSLYTALADTPKDALMAGHPILMDTVPTFAQRRALVTYELAHPWSKGYWETLRPRLQDLFRAYYADDPREVVDFCRKYGVAFLIVDDRHFTPAFLQGGYRLFPGDRPHFPGTSRGLAERFYAPCFAPFDEQIKQITADKHNYALIFYPGFRTLPVSQHVRLIDMRPWLAATP